MCLLIGKFVYLNLGRNVCVERGENTQFGKDEAPKKNGHVWFKWVGWHSLGHANEHQAEHF